MNSLITPGNPNAAHGLLRQQLPQRAIDRPGDNPSIHPSEPNYIWQEGGSNFGVVGNDDDPYANNGKPPELNNNVNLIAATRE